MNKVYKNIDELVQDKFEKFEVTPPESVWKNINHKLHGDNHGNSFLKDGITSITIFIITTTFLTGLLVSDSVMRKGSGKTNNDFTEKLIQKTAIQNIDQNTLVISGEKSNTRSASYKDINNSKSDLTKSKIEQSSVVPEESPVRFEITGKPSTAANMLAKSSITEEMDKEDNYNEGIDDNLLAVNEPLTSMPAQTTRNDIEEMNAGSSVPELKNDYGKKSSLLFGLYFTPEIIVYPSDDKLINKSYSIDIAWTYRFSDYFIQSGLGLSRVTDDGNCRIDYNSFLGSYEDVYNVTFDSTGNGIIPVYHTETVNVYDTITNYNIMPSKREFVYLQVPLLLGYGREFNKFGWHVKGGPSFSLLVHENIPDMGLTNEKHKIVEISNDLPNKIKTNWQFIISAGLDYRFSDHISLSVEPIFRYFINSGYETGNLTTQHPYSYGVRCGLLFNF
jgi:hypothetical protein